MDTPIPRSRTSRPVAAVAATAAVLLVLLAGPVGGAPAAAGGWAVGTLDEVPSAPPGATVPVGFTIRQHGVSPVTLHDERGAPVGIELLDGSGELHWFPARPDGPVGHHVADVTLPDEAGVVEWTLLMGFFGRQPLGELAVGAPGQDRGSPWVWVRWSALSLTVCLAAVAVADLATARRRTERDRLASVEPA